MTSAAVAPRSTQQAGTVIPLHGQPSLEHAQQPIVRAIAKLTVSKAVEELTGQGKGNTCVEYLRVLLARSKIFPFFYLTYGQARKVSPWDLSAWART